MPIKTGSVLEKLEREVIKHANRVMRAVERVEALRGEYKTAHWSKRREIEGKGWRAKQALARAEADLAAAELALKTEQQRLLDPCSFLRFA